MAKFLAKKCKSYKNCNKGDIISPIKPYEVLCMCDKYPKRCKGGIRVLFNSAKKSVTSNTKYFMGEENVHIRK